jgi:hypothetical protein
MNLHCEVVEKTSKAGNPYQVLRINIGSGVKKDVFLNDAEVAILSLTSSQNP